MYALDFEYDNVQLSDYNCIICDFDPPSGADTASIGSEITFNKVPRLSGERFSLVGTQYDGCISASFDICKNPDIYEPADMEITSDEYRSLIKWLNRRQFLPLRFIDEDKMGDPGCYFNASFNVEYIKINGKLYGLRLKMETDSPFGYGDEVVLDYETLQEGDIKINVRSDYMGYIYPKVVITCKSAENIEIRNDKTNASMKISNCKYNEKITIDSQLQTITSSLGRNVLQDFNFTFPVLFNNLFDSINTIHINTGLKITISYTPVIKYIF